MIWWIMAGVVVFALRRRLYLRRKRDRRTVWHGDYKAERVPPEQKSKPL